MSREPRRQSLPTIRSHTRRPLSRPVVAGLAIALPLVLLASIAAVVTVGASAAPSKKPGADVQVATPNPNCTLVVPAAPLSAQGLATPYQLRATDQGAGPCAETNAAQSAFVEATIIDPATGALSVYHPVVVSSGSQPAAAPVVPRLPANAVVGLWFGFNGTTLRLAPTGNSLADGRCVNGLPTSPFGQFAYCNAPAFFAVAHAAIGRKQLTVPAVGTGKDGRPCPTTRDFTIVDQDQSDNVDTSYLAGPNGTIAQNSTANAATLGGAAALVNGSDNRLLDIFVDPALGCQPFTAPDIGDGGKPVPSLALNELSAEAGQAQPVALVPVNDPMVQVDGKDNLAKANLYRLGVGQPLVNPAQEQPRTYCQHLVDLAPPRLRLDQGQTTKAASPDPAVGNSLFTFLALRLSGSFQALKCGDLLGVANPVTVVTNTNGVAVDATFGGGAAASTAPTASNAAPTIPPTIPPGTPSSTAPSTPTGPGTPPVTGGQGSTHKETALRGW